MNLFVNGISFLLLMAQFLSHTEAVATSGTYKDPAHPGKCVVGPNLILSPGESTKIECNIIACGENGEAVLTSRLCDD